MKQARGLWESEDLSFREKKTVPGTQIRFGRMFALNELWVLMVEEQSSAYMHVSNVIVPL